MTNVTMFWQQKRWEHMQKAFELKFLGKDPDTYCLAAAIAYTAQLCHEALDKANKLP